ncbi:MAG: hypothetical protein HY744_28420 [Deltaproteobacteria bacterium]|nr:hypothetical protein [Deltaproteobacteria bacterium]
MKRRQLFEFQDQPWFPDLVREGQVEILSLATRFSGLSAALASAFDRAVQDAGGGPVLDLCSGGGGPVVQLAHELARRGPAAAVPWRSSRRSWRAGAVPCRACCFPTCTPTRRRGAGSKSAPPRPSTSCPSRSTPRSFPNACRAGSWYPFTGISVTGSEGGRSIRAARLTSSARVLAYRSTLRPGPAGALAPRGASAAGQKEGVNTYGS